MSDGERRRQLKEQGLCVWCRDPRDRDGRLCTRCLAREGNSRRIRYHARRAGLPSARQQVCSICQQEGHNARSCKGLNMTTLTPEDFRGVKEVDVLTRWGSQEMWSRARVITVMRAALRVDVLDRNGKPGRECIVRFNQIRLLPVPTTIAPPPPPPPPPTPSPPRHLAAVPPSPPSTPPVNVLPPSKEVEAWLAMGMELLNPLEAEIQRLALSKEGLIAECEALEEELAQKRAEGQRVVEELKKLHAQREQVAKMLANAGARR